MVAIKSLTVSQPGVGTLKVTMFCNDTLSQPQGGNYGIDKMRLENKVAGVKAGQRHRSPPLGSLPFPSHL